MFSVVFALQSAVDVKNLDASVVIGEGDFDRQNMHFQLIYDPSTGLRGLVRNRMTLCSN